MGALLQHRQRRLPRRLEHDLKRPYYRNSKTTLQSISDGTSNTIAFGETLAGNAVTRDFRLSWMGAGMLPAAWEPALDESVVHLQQPARRRHRAVRLLRRRCAASATASPARARPVQRLHLRLRRTATTRWSQLQPARAVGLLSEAAGWHGPLPHPGRFHRAHAGPDYSCRIARPLILGLETSLKAQAYSFPFPQGRKKKNCVLHFFLAGRKGFS